jgi:hypothetical protein
MAAVTASESAGPLVWNMGAGRGGARGDRLVLAWLRRLPQWQGGRAAAPLTLAAGRHAQCLDPLTRSGSGATAWPAMANAFVAHRATGRPRMKRGLAQLRKD